MTLIVGSFNVNSVDNLYGVLVLRRTASVLPLLLSLGRLGLGAFVPLSNSIFQRQSVPMLCLFRPNA